ncbi:hypothetical protein OGM63_19575 [Plectonema radiosum NIES-515]|uniref:Uncharacterized protein n=1 Tax=Plectonema radiosum NIES-515 TaxID=2986073 RepID=A0ABT3B3Y1_9CYAN|nr:hypothetical protein [Plectonema radiosum]MCV3215685.1 hypothetical protein [Plectonema radiosum NIES-515]
MDLAVGIWKPRISQKILGNANIDFPYIFTSQYIGVFASTTNVNPKNRVGYLTQTLYIAALGGTTEVSERFIIINKIPKVIIYPVVLDRFNLRFRFADIVGNCDLKIWEYLPN